ncbi:MAG: tetratricopeptide repeat protein [Leptospirales bacterium]|jgi:tetratricopeptide (TPR) repeat protein
MNRRNTSRQTILRSTGILLLSGVFAYSCGPSIPVRFPQYPRSTGAKLKAVLEGGRNVGVIAAKTNPAILQRIGYENDWSDTMEGAVTTAVSKKGFFEVVDLSGRKERLRELAYTQSGMTAESLAIGRELAVNSMLTVQMTNAPRQECKTEMVADYSGYAMQLALAKAQGDSTDKANLEKKTGVLYLTVFVVGRLTSIETGRTVTYSHTQPFRQVNKVGDTDCPSALLAFDGAVDQAAQGIADNLSPSIVELSVPLLEDADDVGDDESRDMVGGYLASGNQWAEVADFDRAAKDWRRALNESSGQSISALWNLAVYSWYAGEYDDAERYFEQALDGGGPDWLDGAKRELMARFSEQKRLADGARR